MVEQSVQCLSGRVLDLRLKGSWVETQGGTAMCPCAKYLILCLVQVQLRTEKMLTWLQSINENKRAVKKISCQ